MLQIVDQYNPQLAKRMSKYEVPKNKTYFIRLIFINLITKTDSVNKGQFQADIRLLKLIWISS